MPDIYCSIHLDAKSGVETRINICDDEKTKSITTAPPEDESCNNLCPDSSTPDKEACDNLCPDSVTPVKPATILETCPLCPVLDPPLAISSDESQKPPQDFQMLPRILNGAIAGVVGVSCMYPLDLVKTLLQTQTTDPDGHKMYKSIGDCMRQTVRAEGLFGLYRGLSVNIVLITPKKAIKLSANDYFRYILSDMQGNISFPKQMLAGGLAGMCQNFITTPMELLKIAPNEKGKQKAAFEVTRDLFQQKGVIGLYKYLWPTITHDVAFSIIYFPLFATFHEMGPRKSPKSTEAKLWVTFVSGLLAATVASAAVTPFDVVATRMQTMALTKAEPGYSGIFESMRTILKTEGVAALYKGAFTRVMVVSPLFAILQTVYFLGVAEWLLG